MLRARGQNEADEVGMDAGSQGICGGREGKQASQRGTGLGGRRNTTSPEKAVRGGKNPCILTCRCCWGNYTQGSVLLKYVLILFSSKLLVLVMNC